MSTTNEFVLPSVVRPASYAIRLEPDLERFTFNGEETVAIDVAESVSEIVLNAIELEVHSAALQGNGASLNAGDIRLDAARETVTLDFGETVAPGRYDLALTFTGTLNDKLHGFYRSQYTGPDGEPRYMAATQFEATDARRAFPCWDEPECKATFQVTLVIPAGLKAISNTPVEEESQPQPGVTELRFAETPVMSTYLLAFVVGDLTAINGRYQGPGGPTQVAVWTTPGKEEQGRFALDTSVSLLSFFNDYFGIPYPLEKLDHIALPDFAAGAMENWGAITYREIALLVDEANSSAGHPAAGGRGCGPRDGPHVVRRPGHHAMVGRPVAQRELRLVDGHQGGGLAVPRMGDVDAVCQHGHHSRPIPGRVEEFPTP